MTLLRMAIHAPPVGKSANCRAKFLKPTRSILVRQPANQVLAAHDVGGEHHWHADDHDKERRDVLQQDAEVHSPLTPIRHEL